jgi:superfamily II DNA/RNA helicase
MYFDELDLSDNILDALWDMNFEECTPVQEACIPEILNHHDIIGVAQTGTGKTAAYLLPVLSMLDRGNYPDDAINCIVMSPTRELAQQIDQAMQGFGYYLPNISSLAVYGGNDGNRFDQEVKAMREGAGMLIATPGRLISHMQIGNLDLSRCSFFILDEADRMLDMGFSEDILSIAKLLPESCQTIMFSATMPPKIEELAKTLLKNPKLVKLAVSKPAEKIQQSAYVCYEPQKLDIIRYLFKTNQLKRVIIFCGKKNKVKEIGRALVKMKINSGEMHSDLSQAERDEVMYKFKSGQIDVLVATDIVARGIDIDDIAMVINYDVPHDVEDYVHRIGRTARAEKDGIATTFISEDDIYYFKQIERFLEKEITKNPLPEGMIDGPDYASLGNRKPSKNGKFSRLKNTKKSNKTNKRKFHKGKYNSQKSHKSSSGKNKNKSSESAAASKSNEKRSFKHTRKPKNEAKEQ